MGYVRGNYFTTFWRLTTNQEYRIRRWRTVHGGELSVEHASDLLAMAGSDDHKEARVAARVNNVCQFYVIAVDLSPR